MPNDIFQFVQSVASILSSVVAIVAGVRGTIRYLRLRRLKQAAQPAMAPAGRILTESPNMVGTPGPATPAPGWPSPPAAEAPPAKWTAIPTAPTAQLMPSQRPALYIASWWRVIGAGVATFFGFLLLASICLLLLTAFVPSVHTNQYAFEAVGIAAVIPGTLVGGLWGGWIARERNSALTALLLELILFVCFTFYLKQTASTNSTFPALSSTTRWLNSLLTQGFVLVGVLVGVELRTRRARATQWGS